VAAALSLQQIASDQLDAAIRAGRETQPAAYTLGAVPAGDRNTPQPAVALVYTPYLRVALLSAAARAANRYLKPEDIPLRMLEPSTYVAMRARDWYEARHCAHLESDRDVLKVFEVEPDSRRPRGRVLVADGQPVWTSDKRKDVRTLIGDLVSDVSAIGAVAVFSRNAIRGNTVMIWHPLYDCGDGKKVGPEFFAYVRPDDPASWR
jgi:hypothetical protein